MKKCCDSYLYIFMAMKNSIHYSKQNTAKAFRVIAALVSLMQSLCFAPCNVIYYYIITFFRISYNLTEKWNLDIDFFQVLTYFSFPNFSLIKKMLLG